MRSSNRARKWRLCTRVTRVTCGAAGRRRDDVRADRGRAFQTMAGITAGQGGGRGPCHKNTPCEEGGAQFCPIHPSLPYAPPLRLRSRIVKGFSHASLPYPAPLASLPPPPSLAFSAAASSRAPRPSTSRCLSTNSSRTPRCSSDSSPPPPPATPCDCLALVSRHVAKCGASSQLCSGLFGPSSVALL